MIISLIPCKADPATSTWRIEGRKVLSHMPILQSTRNICSSDCIEHVVHPNSAQVHHSFYTIFQFLNYCFSHITMKFLVMGCWRGACHRFMLGSVLSFCRVDISLSGTRVWWVVCISMVWHSCSFACSFTVGGVSPFFGDVPSTLWCLCILIDVSCFSNFLVPLPVSEILVLYCGFTYTLFQILFAPGISSSRIVRHHIIFSLVGFKFPVLQCPLVSSKSQ